MNSKLLAIGYEVLGETLIEARKEAGFTQADVAQRLKKPQSFVSKYERGERRLDVVEFIFVLRALGLEDEAMAELFYALDTNIPALNRKRKRRSR